MSENKATVPRHELQNTVWQELEKSIHAALETYANVHRGSGHASRATTHLYELARELVLDHLGLDQASYRVIFGSPRSTARLESRLKPGSWHSLSSREIGLPLGIRALAIRKKALSGVTPPQVGGGMARLVSPDTVVWARGSDHFEAGTPAIINVIALTRALQLLRRYGLDTLTPDPISETRAASWLGQDELDAVSGQDLLDRLRRSCIGLHTPVPTLEGDKPFVNLDNGASTPTFSPVWDSFRRTWRLSPDVHGEVIRGVKTIIGEFLGAKATDYETIFTVNTTEAINLVAEHLGRQPDTVVLNTFLEHNSNELPWRSSPNLDLIRLPVDDEGFVDLAELEKQLLAFNQSAEHAPKRIRLVSVSGASNVLGVYNDLSEIARIVHQYDARLLVDGAQLIAHRPIDIGTVDIDYFVFSAHKAYAPFGSGVLLARKGLLAFSPDEWSRIQESGKENVAGIAALGKALQLLRRIGLERIQAEEQALTARALVGLTAIPGLKVYGIQDPESPSFAGKGGVIVFELKGWLPHRAARTLTERYGIGLRYGCHCAHLLIKRLLHVPRWAESLQGWMVRLIPQLNLPGLVRISLGIENTAADIDALIQALGKLARKQKPPIPARAEDRQRLKNFPQMIARRVFAP